MTYQRFRERNNLKWRPGPGESLYSKDILVGDLNRMEKDYLDPEYPVPPGAIREPGSSPSEQVAEATGVAIEDVRKVLQYVFLEQR